MTIKEIKKNILTTKKDNKELSKAYAAILNQIEKQTIGVENPETDEKKLVLKAIKTELKELTQSKEANAPYSEVTFELVTSLFKELSPKLMSEREIEVSVDNIIIDLQNPNMGQIMGRMKQEYGDKLDMKILSTIVKNKLAK